MFERNGCFQQVVLPMPPLKRNGMSIAARHLLQRLQRQRQGTRRAALAALMLMTLLDGPSP